MNAPTTNFVGSYFHTPPQSATNMRFVGLWWRGINTKGQG